LDRTTGEVIGFDSAGSRPLAAVMKRAPIMLALGIIVSACAATGAPSTIPSVGLTSVAPTAVVDPQVLELTVNDFAFSMDLLEADADRPITIAFSNEDGVVHNFQLWRDDAREEKLFFGELVDGPATIEYALGVLEPGTYRFECSPHAGTMFGHLVVE
jgi:plastocyanin